MMQYKVGRCLKEVTSAIGSDLTSFLTASELWSYDEDLAMLYSEKDAKEIALNYCELEFEKPKEQFDYFIKSV